MFSIYSLLSPARKRVDVPAGVHVVIVDRARNVRVAGPGLVELADGESVFAEIAIKEVRHTVLVSGLYAYGKTFTYEVSFFASYAPASVTWADRERLRKCLQLREGERRDKINAYVRALTVDAVTRYQRLEPLRTAGDPEELFEQFHPGYAANIFVQDCIMSELPKALWPVGVLVNSEAPLSLHLKEWCTVRAWQLYAKTHGSQLNGQRPPPRAARIKHRNGPTPEPQAPVSEG